LSHLKERQEKNCLNCNAQLQGKYCHICGQENIEPKETVWHLVGHFFQDITHFDGKFFSTLKLLVFRPGFLSREYMAGRRASYLNPVRMYVFTSAFFFIIFFTFFNTGIQSILKDATIDGKSLNEVDKMDSTTFANFTRKVNREDKKPDLPMTREEFKKYTDLALQKSGIHLTKTHYRSKAQYDSLLAAGVKKHNWWQKLLIYKEIEVNEKYDSNSSKILIAFRDSIIHSLPQMLFISLPLLALLLKLLYVRRKKFYYVNHAIFSIHLYIFIFIALLFILSLGKLNEQLNFGLITFINGLLYLGLFFYAYKAMRNFYQQGRAKTILKFVLLNLMFAIVVLVLFISFVLFSFFKI